VALDAPEHAVLNAVLRRRESILRHKIDVVDVIPQMVDEVVDLDNS